MDILSLKIIASNLGTRFNQTLGFCNHHFCHIEYVRQAKLHQTLLADSTSSLVTERRISVNLFIGQAHQSTARSIYIQGEFAVMDSARVLKHHGFPCFRLRDNQTTLPLSHLKATEKSINSGRYIICFEPSPRSNLRRFMLFNNGVKFSKFCTRRLLGLAG